MSKSVDILGLWDLFIGFFNRLVAWMVFVLGGGEWDPGAVD